MTGHDVKTIREWLGLNAHAFAAVLGIHVASVYRWETTKKDLTIDPLQREIIAGLSKIWAATKPIPARIEAGRAMGDRITKALQGSGSLAALRVVLDAILKEIPHGQ